MKQFSTFELRLYTQIVFGKETEKRTGKLVKEHGGSKVLVVYGGGSIKRNGLYDRVTASLRKERIPFVELPGVQPNPRRSLVDKGIALSKAEEVDFILAVGGGSTLDTAKAIGYALYNEGDWWNFYLRTAQPKGMMPVGSIHTIAAAGSETSMSSVILDDVETNIKKSSNSQYGRPVFAIMNPELTYTVSPYQTGAGTADIFAHTLERYFFQDNCELGDEFAQGLLRTVVKYGPIAYREPDNYEARAELMLAASFSHNDITGIGHAGRRGGPHRLESPLSSAFDTAHGAGLAVVMPAWLKLVADRSEKGCARVAKLAIEVFGVAPDLADLKLVAYEGIARFKDWIRAIGMPMTLRELGVKEEDLAQLPDMAKVNADGVVEGYENLTKDDLQKIYKNVL